MLRRARLIPSRPHGVGDGLAAAVLIRYLHVQPPGVEAAGRDGEHHVVRALQGRPPVVNDFELQARPRLGLNLLRNLEVGDRGLMVYVMQYQGAVLQLGGDDEIPDDLRPPVETAPADEYDFARHLQSTSAWGCLPVRRALSQVLPCGRRAVRWVTLEGEAHPPTSICYSAK